MPQDIKAFFHEWCSKSKVDPQFEVRPTGKTRFAAKFADSLKINNSIVFI